MRIAVPVIASAALTLALPAVAEAASTKRIPACDGAGKTAARCGSGGAAEAKRTVKAIPGSWSIVGIDIAGTTNASDDDPDFTFTMAGGTTIRSGGKLAGRFKRPDASIVQATASPVTTKLTSSAHWTGTGTETYNCDLKWGADAPTTVTATGGSSRTIAGGISLQWNFVPSGWADCVLGDDRVPAPSPPTAPSDLTTTTYPASAFRKAARGAERQLLVDIDRTWSEGGITVKQTWKGSVTVRATKKVA